MHTISQGRTGAVPGGTSEVFITLGDDEKLRGKAMFLLRAIDGPLDVEKVREAD